MGAAFARLEAFGRRFDDEVAEYDSIDEAFDIVNCAFGEGSVQLVRETLAGNRQYLDEMKRVRRV